MQSYFFLFGFATGLLVAVVVVIFEAMSSWLDFSGINRWLYKTINKNGDIYRGVYICERQKKEKQKEQLHPVKLHQN